MEELELVEYALKEIICDPIANPRVRNLAIDCMCLMAHGKGIRQAFPEFTRPPDRKISALLEEIFAQHGNRTSEN